MKGLMAIILLVANLSLDDIILDIYRAVTESGEVNYEQLQSDLYALHRSPIDLNATSEEELSQLLFLSPRQIDDLLAYADKHPFESLYELRLIPSLEDYDIRNLQPFVQVSNKSPSETPRTRARHELIGRVDARNIEDYEGSDPMYTHIRYRLDYQRRVVFGAQLRRPAGGGARDLLYGGYLQLHDFGHLHTFVAGNFQASFGQGLVFANVFRMGKSGYVSNAGYAAKGLHYYSSVDGEGLHGAGATLRWKWGKQTVLDVSALYSLKHANDSTWHHVVGANMTLRHKRLQVELTAAENIWTDSIRPYNNTAYNAHYFRGYRQAVIGASARYNYGWFDAFAEVAAAQNRRWGFGTLIGCRFYPTQGVSLVALYRYYSPWFDNALGYAFSESSRLGDENGGYLGWDITRWKNWRLSGYADLFYFSGPKFGIPQSSSFGYDLLLEPQFIRDIWQVSLRLRARRKGVTDTYSTRAFFHWQQGCWSLRTTGEANLVPATTDKPSLTYGVTLYQDVTYSLPLKGDSGKGLSLTLRLQGFDAREWENRIYCYEHDVLYAFSNSAMYGLGGRAYILLRWQIIPQLALYFRASETLYERRWASSRHKAQNRTDLHLLLRACF